MTESKLFISNRSQAVRLPKAVAFPDGVKQVEILKVGRSRLVVPKGERWDDLFRHGPRATEDFLSERAQPASRGREDVRQDQSQPRRIEPHLAVRRDARR
jgi:antitoxin VapB